MKQLSILSSGIIFLVIGFQCGKHLKLSSAQDNARLLGRCEPKGHEMVHMNTISEEGEKALKKKYGADTIQVIYQKVIQGQYTTQEESYLRFWRCN